MRLLLINPVLKGDFTSLHNGLVSIASYINRETHHKVQIADLSFQRKHWKSYLKETMFGFRPDLVGLTVSYIYYDCAFEVADFIKSISKAKVIFGGPHIIVNPDEVIKEPSVDYICLNDGEEVLKELLDGIELKENVSSIQGLWVKDDGEVIRNPRRPLSQDLGRFSPWNWDLYNDLDKQLYFFRHIPIQGSRGCKYDCSFCSAKIMRECSVGQFCRWMDPKLMAEEAKYQYDKYKNNYLGFFRFCDPVFTQHYDWMKNFALHYEEVGLKGFPYSVLARIDHLDEDKLKLLKETGCVELRLGLESGDDYIRNDIFKKGIKTELIRETIRLIQKYKISIVGYFIIGAPGETKETLRVTSSFVKEINIDTPAIFSYKPVTKTEACATLFKMGGRVDEKKRKEIVSLFKGEIVYTPYLTPNQVHYYKIILSSYVFFRKLWKEIRERGLKFFIEFPLYLRKGLKSRMDFESIIASFLNRKHTTK
ncbi:MAG: radical SAM protein [Candidatus Omnitrophica bacterium]|nr:radical SAM protein [Candidatus Omnitrophota bacterium]